jgi:hypothetical protein
MKNSLTYINGCYSALISASLITFSQRFTSHARSSADCLGFVGDAA